MHFSVGEVPGSESIRQTLEDARALVVGHAIGDYNAILNAIRAQFADRDSGGRGLQTFDNRITIHAVTAVASRCSIYSTISRLAAALLGEGQQRKAVETLGYLFYVGDRRKTNFPYPTAENQKDDRLRLRTGTRGYT